MTKPWEEEWELNPIQRAAVVLKGERKTVLWAGNPLKATTPEDVERARLAVQAPRLYRALEALASLYDADEGCRSLPEYLQAQAALKAARGEE